MRTRLVLLLAITLATQPSHAVVEVADFNQFTVETHLSGTGFDVPVWQVSPDGRLACGNEEQLFHVPREPGIDPG